MTVASGQRLGRRVLNRALVQRQLLSRPAALPVAEAVERLVGMQAQLPAGPYIGLWSRLAGFAHRDLADLITVRRLVRVALMRSTIHLVTARDCRLLRPAVQQALDRDLFANAAFGPPIEGMDLQALRAEAREALAEGPMTAAQLGKRLQRRWPERDPGAMAYAVRNLEALVQVPPRGLWGRPGQARYVTAADWLKADWDNGAAAAPRLDAMVLRYLAAFGPATVRDIQAWSGVRGLAEIVEPLRRRRPAFADEAGGRGAPEIGEPVRPRLRAFADEDGRELWDLPDAPIPDADSPAPPRFLPEYDNALLGYADRRRVMPDGMTFAAYAGRLRPRSVVRGGVLIGGFLAGVWSITRQAAGGHVLVIEPFDRLPSPEAADLEKLGRRLLAFVAGDDAGGRVELG